MATPERTLALDRRLSSIAEMIGRADCCADIGCDHGRLGAFMLQTGRCHRVQFLEISEPSLMKAKRLVVLLGLADRAVFGVGDGASAMRELADVVIIAGMGGVTIAQIITQGREKLGSARLILQPNVAAPELRAALQACGYQITDERIAPDGRRHYPIIEARPGAMRLGERQRVVGPVLLEQMPPELAPYAAFRLRVAQKALAGAAASGDAEAISSLTNEARIWEEVDACLKRSATS